MDGYSDSFWGSPEGLPGGGDEGVARLEEAGSGVQKLDGGLRFGMQIPPPQEVLTEPLLISACLAWGRGSVPLGVVCRQRLWKEGTAPQPPAVG